MAEANLGIGVEKFRVAIRRLKSSAAFFFGVGVLVCVIVFAGLLAALSDAVESRAAVAQVIAGFASPDTMVSFVLDDGVTKQKSFAVDILNSEWVVVRADSFWIDFYVCLALAIIVSLVSVFLLAGYLREKGGSQHVRGGISAHASELEDAAKGVDFLNAKIGDIPLAKKAYATGGVLIGDSGTGKSQIYHSLIQDAIANKRRLFVYDRSGDFTAAYYREGYDVILNPFDVRMPYWNLFSEIVSDFDYLRIAKSFVPSSDAGASNSNVSHWETTPRQLLSDVMEVMDREEDHSHSALIRRLTSADLESISAFVKGTASEAAMAPDNEKHALSVLSSLGAKINPIRYVKSGRYPIGFSIRKWVQNKDDDRRIFINVSKDQKDMAQSLISFWIDLAVSEILSRNEGQRDDEVVFFLDELQSLDKLGSLEEAFNEMRKNGGRAFVGVTSLKMFISKYGENTAKAIISTAGIKAVLSNGDPDSASYLSNMLSKREEIRYNESIQEKQGSQGVTEQKSESALFTASEIMNLPDLNVIIKQKGCPVSKTEMTTFHPELVAMSIAVGEESTIDRMPSETVAKQKPLPKKTVTKKTDDKLSEKQAAKAKSPKNEPSASSQQTLL